MKAAGALLALLILAGCEPKPEEPPFKAPPVKSEEPEPKIAKASDSRIYPLDSLEKATLKFGGKPLVAWVMDTESKRNEGLMFLEDSDLKADAAMLFSFKQEQPLAFWMRNTLVDLDIAYINKKGVVVSNHLMLRLDETSVPAAGPAMYALEMKAGAFKRLGIKKGTQFAIPPEAAAAD